MLSPPDVRSLISMQENNTESTDAFVVMLSNESIFAITVLEPISTYPVDPDLANKLSLFEEFYRSRVKNLIDSYNDFTDEGRKKYLEKLFLLALKEVALEDKIGLFEGTTENDTDTDINNYNIKWTRKELKSVFLGYTVNEKPCDE